MTKTIITNIDPSEGEDDTSLDIPDGARDLDPDEYFARSAFRVVHQTNNFFLPQIKDLIEKREIINLRPEYQRRLRWSTKQKSRLIESLLLNIPVPPVFLYESDAARYEVMDGQQRLNAVREFLAGDVKLGGLSVLVPLNGLTYGKCPPRVKRALDRATIAAIVLLLETRQETSASPLRLTDIRRFVFDRLNTGGTKLNPQEIRNAVYQGNFNQSLVNLSRFPLFTEVFDIPRYVETDPNDYYENEKRQKNTLYATMGDCQLILRYFALRDDHNIRGSMRSMLDRAMADRVTLSIDNAKSLEQRYMAIFELLYRVFDDKPFTLPPDEKGNRRVSAAVYDASMVAMDGLWDKRAEIEGNKSAVQTALAQAYENEALFALLTGQGNTAQAVRDRIDLMRQILNQG